MLIINWNGDITEQYLSVNQFGLTFTFDIVNVILNLVNIHQGSFKK